MGGGAAGGLPVRGRVEKPPGDTGSRRDRSYQPGRSHAPAVLHDQRFPFRARCYLPSAKRQTASGTLLSPCRQGPTNVALGIRLLQCLAFIVLLFAARDPPL